MHFTQAILDDVGVSDMQNAMPDDDIRFQSLAELLVDLILDNNGYEAAAISHRQNQLVRVDRGGWHLPHVVPVTATDISHDLRFVASWNWHHTRKSEDLAKGALTVRLEAIRLDHVDGEFDIEGVQILRPVGGNLNNDGVMEIENSDKFFGIKIITLGETFAPACFILMPRIKASVSGKAIHCLLQNHIAACCSQW